MKSHAHTDGRRAALVRCTVVAVWVFAGWSGPTRAADTTVAVVVTGAKRDDARSFAKRLRAAVGDVPGHRALSAKKTRKALGAAKREIQCALTDDGCPARLAARMPADLLLVAVAGTEAIELRTYDPVTGARLAMVGMPLSALSPAGDNALADLVARVVTPDMTHGTLVVTTLNGATVTVDGLPSVSGPTARFEGLPSGVAHITVAVGDRRAELEVKVASGAVTDVQLMPPSPPPPPPASGASVLNTLSIGGAVLGGLGLVVALGGAGGAVGLDLLLVMPGETVPPSLRSPLWFMEVAFALAATAGVVTLLGGAATAGAGVALGVME